MGCKWRLLYELWKHDDSIARNPTYCPRSGPGPRNAAADLNTPEDTLDRGKRDIFSRSGL